MQDSWIPLQCTNCETEMEYSPSDLPAASEEFTCEHCGTTRPTREFVMTQEGLKILEKFHA